jgi:hypothetical protein
MATDFLKTPQLTERIAAADVIAVASTGRLVGVERDPTEGVGRVFGLFELLVENVISGDLPQGTVLLRVLGDGEDERARWLVPVQEGRRLVLLMARDVGPELPENTFAPVHASGFELEDDGRVRIPEDAVDDLTRRVAELEGSHVTVDGLRRLVEVVRQDREAAAREMAELLPEDALTRLYPEVEERPDVAERSLAAAVDAGVQGRPATIGTAAEGRAGGAGSEPAR